MACGPGFAWNLSAAACSPCDPARLPARAEWARDCNYTCFPGYFGPGCGSCRAMMAGLGIIAPPNAAYPESNDTRSCGTLDWDCVDTQQVPPPVRLGP